MPSDYQSRLAAMEDWYKVLVASDYREQALLEDYTPHRAMLGSLTGRVIDVGGGAGIAARFLRPEVDLVVVDPSEVWDSPEWVEFGRSFRAGGPEPKFVKAIGEDLPFADGQFDAALSFWSLNHVADPERCIAEIARVLKPGGVVRLVVDDIEPSWWDLAKDGIPRIRARLNRTKYVAEIHRPLIQALRLKASGRWPLQDDHLRITEFDLCRWLSGRFQIQRRKWLMNSLTFDLAKSGRPLA